MPELPEVETVRCGLAPAMVGARIAAVVQRRADLRFPLPARFATRLTGRRVERLERRAKYLLAYLDADEVLTMHLGMTGRFTVAWPGGGNGGGIERPGLFTHEAGGEDRHDHIVFEMSTGVRVTYNDARRFGYMDLVPAAGLETHKHFKGLGVEPLSEALTPAYLAAAARDRRVDLKALLLDQRVIAGLGNIYVVEALFRAGLRPSRPAATLADRSGAPRESAVRLVASIREVLGEAIAAGGSSLRDYRQASGEPGGFQGAHAVYDREGEPCLRPGCRGTIRRSVQGGRSSFYCPRCQR